MSRISTKEINVDYKLKLHNQWCPYPKLRKAFYKLYDRVDCQTLCWFKHSSAIGHFIDFIL